MHFKKGDRVTCTIQGVKINDARIQIEGDVHCICQNEIEGFDCKDKLGYEYSWAYHPSDSEVIDLKLAENQDDPERAEVGDILKKGDLKLKVEAVIGNLIAVTNLAEEGDYIYWEILGKMKPWGYRIDRPTETVEVDGKKWLISTVRAALEHYHTLRETPQ